MITVARCLTRGKFDVYLRDRVLRPKALFGARRRSLRSRKEEKKTRARHVVLFKEWCQANHLLQIGLKAGKEGGASEGQQQCGPRDDEKQGVARAA